MRKQDFIVNALNPITNYNKTITAIYRDLFVSNINKTDNFQPGEIRHTSAMYFE